MKFYRVISSSGWGNQGCLFFTNKRDAEKEKRTQLANWIQSVSDWDWLEVKIEPVDVTPTKQGIKQALNLFGSQHP